MASVVVNGDTSGAVTLSAPAVAGTVTVTLPAASGTMASLASVTANGVAYINSSGQPTSGSALVFDGTNLGVGVTPSAWGVYKAIDILSGGAVFGAATNYAGLGSNCFNNGSGWRYKNTAVAGLYQLETNTHVWYTAPSGTAGNAITFTQAMTLDASGNLGIGTTSPLVPLHVVTTGTGTTMGSNTVATFRSGASGRASTIQLSDGTTSNYVSSLSGSLGFGSAGTELMRLDSSGNLLVGTASKLAGGVDGLDINTAAESGITFAKSGTVKNYFYLNSDAASFRWQTVSGVTADVVSNTNGVTLTNGATSWATLSDERKKDIIEPITDAATKVSSLRAVIGKYKTEEDGIRRAMLIAQDVQAVLPEAVVENKDGELLLQYTEIIPLLVAAIKEQSALITQLQADVAALKGAA